jgi:hypothetical protein
MSAFFRAFSLVRDIRSLRSPHTAVARLARKAAVRTINRQIR